ncbi:MAG: Xaa-Pro dipeptidase, partial [Lysobacterales bacterium]
MTADNPHTPLAALYPAHVQTLCARADEALAAGGFEHLLLPSGTLRYQFLDDRPYPFAANPQFKAWLPLEQVPDSWLAYTPGRRPRLVYCQPDDYWHLPPAPPHGYWAEQFEIIVVRSAAQAAEHLPTGSATARCAILGEPDWRLPGRVPNNPTPVLERLHWARAVKTAYELEALRMANARAVRGHL